MDIFCCSSDALLKDALFSKIKDDLDSIPAKFERVLLVVPAQSTLLAEEEAFSHIGGKGFLTLNVVSGEKLRQDIMHETGGSGRVMINTIGRGMGRTDTDGASIFEGDIIQCGARRYIVCYGDCVGVKNTSHDVGYVGFYFKAIYDDDLWRTDPIYYLNAYSCKVIGNIYDNAELLLLEVNNEDD